MSSTPTENSVCPLILIPVHNDWVAVGLLLQLLDVELKQAGLSARVMVVDDGSTKPIPDPWCVHSFQALQCIDVLELRCNLGHQRALAVGLAHIEAHVNHAPIVVMDGDGEDAPRDVPRLLKRFDSEGRKTLVFAQRTQRSEGFVFRCGYAIYLALHRLLTGHRIRVGNFSVIPESMLTRLVAMSDLWNHYAATVFKARLPFVTEPTPRGQRLAGRSRMNFVALVIHGLSAMSVFSDRIGVRLLILASSVLAISLAGLGAVVGVRLWTDWAVPGWATTAAGLLVVVGMQGLLMMIVFIMIVLGGRGTAGFLPIRDSAYFVGKVRRVWSKV